MKKCLSLIAILGLIASTSFAAAPNFPEVPSVKIATGQGLTPAFDLAAYNTGDAATTASVVTNPSNLSALSTTFASGVITVANVNYGTYALSSAFSFTYRFANEGGSANAANKAKYSNNRMKKLPVIGLNVGSSADIVVGNYVVGTYPVSFGNTGALAFDTTKISATWQNNSTVRVTLLAAISAPVKVGVIASQRETEFFGDVDKEEITVAQNLLTGYTFDTNEVATAFGYEIDGSVMASQTYDSAEKALKISFVNNSGIKMTQSVANWFNLQQGNWYIARARVKASAPSIATKLFVLNGNPGVDPTIDVMANIPFSTSSTNYEWVEAPFYVYANYTVKNAYIQMYVDANSGSWWLDELQLIKATPNLMNTRAISNLKVAAGTFSTSSLAGWGLESYGSYGSGSYEIPANSVISGKYTVDFAGAGAGNAAKGLKLTFASAPGVPQAFASAGNEIGMSMNITKVSGAFNTLDSSMLMAMLGYNASNALDQVTAMAQLGTLTFGDYYLAADGREPSYNAQFFTKSGAAGVQTIDNVDVLKDLDGYVFGDANLF